MVKKECCALGNAAPECRRVEPRSRSRDLVGKIDGVSLAHEIFRASRTLTVPNADTPCRARRVCRELASLREAQDPRRIVAATLSDHSAEMRARHTILPDLSGILVLAFA
jgi:hypothetical protein